MPRNTLTQADIDARIRLLVPPMIQEALMAYKSTPATAVSRFLARKFTAAQAPLGDPGVNYDAVETVYVLTAAATETMYTANGAGLQDTIKNDKASTANLTFGPKSGETFEGGTTPIVLLPGDAQILTRLGPSSTDWKLS